MSEQLDSTCGYVSGVQSKCPPPNPPPQFPPPPLTATNTHISRPLLHLLPRPLRFQPRPLSRGLLLPHRPEQPFLPNRLLLPNNLLLLSRTSHLHPFLHRRPPRPPLHRPRRPLLRPLHLHRRRLRRSILRHCLCRCACCENVSRAAGYEQ